MCVSQKWGVQECAEGSLLADYIFKDGLQ